MICYHILSPAAYFIPHGEQEHKTIAYIVQSLFPFLGKQDLSVGQTAFEHLIWPNQISSCHVAVTQTSGAEKIRQFPTLGAHPGEPIAVLAIATHISAQRCVMFGMKIVPQLKKGKSWWVCKDLKWTTQILLANCVWFPENSGIHRDKIGFLVPGSNSRQAKHNLPFCRSRNLLPGSVNDGYVTTDISMACSIY